MIIHIIIKCIFAYLLYTLIELFLIIRNYICLALIFDLSSPSKRDADVNTKS